MSWPAESCQRSNASFQRGFSAHTIEYEIRSGAGCHIPYLFRRGCITRERIVRAVFLRELEMLRVAIHSDNSSRAESPEELNGEQPQTSHPDDYGRGSRNE